MNTLHHYVAYSVPTGFGLLALWALISFVRNRPPGGAFWNLLAVIQIVLGVQVVAGGILFLMGRVPPTNGPTWLHYAYGGLFPIALLIAGHRVARRYPDIPWVVFGVVAFVCFGLTLRALQTGLGID